ncbi:MAG: dihydropteroate synthase [bacterium]
MGSVFKIGSATFDFSKNVYVMGILNVTPDSFSDGGFYHSPQVALQRALQMEEEGADLIDLGAESTRPGAAEISVSEEWRRLSPVLEALQGKLKVPLSLDTRKAEIARRALPLGVALINDVSGFAWDPEMLPFLRESRVPAVLMHSRGTPETMGKLTQYGSVVKEVFGFLEARLQELEEKGVERKRLVVDPGFGFAKTPEQNVELLSHLKRFQEWGRPVLVGLSRKSFLDKYFAPSLSPGERGGATEVAHTLAVLRGANILRVHDVKAARNTIRFAQACRLTHEENP